MACYDTTSEIDYDGLASLFRDELTNDPMNDNDNFVEFDSDILESEGEIREANRIIERKILEFRLADMPPEDAMPQGEFEFPCPEPPHPDFTALQDWILSIDNSPLTCNQDHVKDPTMSTMQSDLPRKTQTPCPSHVITIAECKEEAPRGTVKRKPGRPRDAEQTATARRAEKCRKKYKMLDESALMHGGLPVQRAVQWGFKPPKDFELAIQRFQRQQNWELRVEVTFGDFRPPTTRRGPKRKKAMTLEEERSETQKKDGVCYYLFVDCLKFLKSKSECSRYFEDFQTKEVDETLRDAIRGALS